MKTCPNCGNELHDDSTFCFACMTAVNEREDIQIKLNSPYKKAIPVACIAVAVIAASSVFAVVSRKNNAVETKPAEPAQAVTTSATVTTIPQTTPATTTTVPTTTTTAPAPTADEIIKIAGGLRQASTGTAGTTTTTTTEPVTEPPEDIQQYDEQDNTDQNEDITNNGSDNNDNDNNSTQSPDIANILGENNETEYTKEFIDIINPERKKNGLEPLKVSGKFDDILKNSITEDKIYDTGTKTTTTNYLVSYDQVIEKLEKLGLSKDNISVVHFYDYWIYAGKNEKLDDLYKQRISTLFDEYSYIGNDPCNITKDITDYKYVGICQSMNKKLSSDLTYARYEVWILK